MNSFVRLFVIEKKFKINTNLSISPMAKFVALWRLYFYLNKKDSQQHFVTNLILNIFFCYREKI